MILKPVLDILEHETLTLCLRQLAHARILREIIGTCCDTEADAAAAGDVDGASRATA